MNTSSPKILVTGSGGQLASALRKQATAQNMNLVFCDKSSLDITNPASIEREILTHKPNIIINTAAFTAVDKAESQQEQAKLVNHEGAKNIATLCAKHHIFLIHLSTDYVFDGTVEHGFNETDNTKPLNIYGKSKLLGEQSIQEYGEQYVILRVSGIFSEFGNNFLKTMLRLAEERDEVNVVNDQFACPTYADDIAKALITITNNPSHTGIYHFCSRPSVSWYEFAKYIIGQANTNTTVRGIKTAEYPLPTHRSAYSILNCDKIKNDYGISQPEWKNAVDEVVPLLMKRKTL